MDRMVDLGSRQMGAVADPGQGRREHLVAARSHQRTHLFPRPATGPGTVHYQERRHRFRPRHPGGEGPGRRARHCRTRRHRADRGGACRRAGATTTISAGAALCPVSARMFSPCVATNSTPGPRRWPATASPRYVQRRRCSPSTKKHSRAGSTSTRPSDASVAVSSSGAAAS